MFSSMQGLEAVNNLKGLLSFLKDPFSSKVIKRIKAQEVELQRIRTQKIFREEWNKLVKNE